MTSWREGSHSSLQTLSSGADTVLTTSSGLQQPANTFETNKVAQRKHPDQFPSIWYKILAHSIAADENSTLSLKPLS